jgi:hypothetical protein
MDKLGKILFPIAAVAVTISAIMSKDWLRLGIAALFIIAAIRAFKADEASDVKEENDQLDEPK